MQGIITLTVKIFLESDATEEEVKDIVSDLDYTFSHPRIADTEIIDFK